MDLDALLKMLMDMFKNNPTMILLLTMGFFLLKFLMPTPGPASKQVLDSYADRIRLALQAGNVEGAKTLATEGVEKAGEYLKAESEPKPKGILDIFTGLFTGGNLMPLLMIGGVFLLLMMTSGGGCSKTSEPAPKLTVTPAVNENPNSGEFSYEKGSHVLHDAVYRWADAAAVAPALPAGFEWAEPVAGPWSDPDARANGPGADGFDRGGNRPAYSGHWGPALVCRVADGTCRDCVRAPAQDCGPGRYRVGRVASPRAGPVARVARFSFRPAARVAVGLARVLRWARPFRRAAAVFRLRRA